MKTITNTALTLATIGISFILSLPASAEIYRTTDENGRIIFTDKAATGSKTEEIKLQETNTQPATVIPPKIEKLEPLLTEEDSTESSYTLKLTSPADETTVPMGQMTLTSHVALSTSLAKGHRIQFYLNSKAVGKPTTKTSHTFKELFRGAHTIHAAIIGKKGKVLVKSNSSTIFVHRAKIKRMSIPRPVPN